MAFFSSFLGEGGSILAQPEVKNSLTELRHCTITREIDSHKIQPPMVDTTQVPVNEEDSQLTANLSYLELREALDSRQKKAQLINLI